MAHDYSRDYRLFTHREKLLIVLVAMYCFAAIYLLARYVGLTWAVWW